MNEPERAPETGPAAAPYVPAPEVIVVRVTAHGGVHDGQVLETAGTFLQLEEHAAVLRDPSLDLSLDRLMERLMRHTGHRLNDDTALVLAEHR